MVPRRLVAVLACAAALACGKSKQEKAFDQIGTICNGLVAEGATLAQAFQQTGINDAINAGVGLASSAPACGTETLLLAPFAGDQCPAQSVANPECEVIFEWQTTDPGLCSSQGGCCFLCQIRVMKGSITTADNGASTPICAARWLSGQFCQALP
jgi:hypothetical protein